MISCIPQDGFAQTLTVNRNRLVVELAEDISTSPIQLAAFIIDVIGT